MKIIRNTRLWSILTGVFSFLLCIFLIGTYFGITYATMVNNFLNVSTTVTIKDENADEDTEYYKSQFSSSDELSKWQKELCEQIQGEGSVLIMNNNDALPVEKGVGVTTFGRSSADIIYCGTGSGQVDTESAATMSTALNEAGFKVNQNMLDWYAGKIQALKDAGLDRSTAGWMAEWDDIPDATRLAEIPVDEVRNSGVSLDGYKDLALVVIGRSGGEGTDLPHGEFSDGTSYFELQEVEKDLLKYVAGLGFDKIVVLINSSNAMTLNWIDDPEYKIDACLWIGGPGQYGLNSVAKILCGDINPSGRFVDTYSSSTLSAPAMQNFGAFSYSNGNREEGTVGGVLIDGRPEDQSKLRYAVFYMIEKEGIYVGYKYYETRYEDIVLGQGNANGNAGVVMSTGGKWNYNDEVDYAFGYGLSYTTFTQQLLGVEFDRAADNFIVKVQVTNTGDVAGKEVVQVYGQQPYTQFDRENGIEKASVQLVGFGKTDMLAPGAKQTVEITVDRKELAAYDEYVNKTYIFEEGDYYLAIGSDAHDAVNNILAAKGFDTSDGMDKNGDDQKVYKFHQNETDTTTYAYSDVNTGVKITNQFEEADLNYYGKDMVTYLTRNDWQGTYPTPYKDLTATEEMIHDLQFNYEADNSVPDIVTGSKDTAYSVVMMRGLDYDNPLWQDLLDQMTLEEMANAVGYAGYRGAGIDSVALPTTRHNDGPQGISGGFGQKTKIAYTSEVVMASTYNTDIMHNIGLSMGEDALRMEGDSPFCGWYGPAINIHRTPYCGRNFEYFSEDGFLSGKMVAREIEGAQSMGLCSFVKHFALNDFETNRQSAATFNNEQAIREIYLKPFEYAVKDGGTGGIMSSYNRIGCRWAGAHKGLLTNVLREEWGFNGAVLTDATTNSRLWMDVRIGLEAGNNLWLNGSPKIAEDLVDMAKADKKLAANMRESCHHYLYAMANSSAVNGLSSNDRVITITPAWQISLYVVDSVMGVLAVAGAVLIVVASIKNKKRENA